jgi:cytochrome c oxidase assembly protein subunit 19
MAAPPQLRVTAKGPELGAFPLDHFRECKTEIESYYRCLEAHAHVAPMCRDQVRTYLACRMDRGLMNRTDMSNFGLPETTFVPTRQHKEDVKADAFRAGGTAIIVGPVWESKFKASELQRDDGFEADPKTGQPVVGKAGGAFVEPEQLPIRQRYQKD